jgi:hypothetical protein
MFIHADDFVGVKYRDSSGSCAKRRKLTLNHGLLTGECDLYVKSGGGFDCATDDRCRRLIAPHRVDDNSHGG